MILNKILDGKDRCLLIVRCGDLLGKDAELGNDIAAAYNTNKDHQYRIYTGCPRRNGQNSGECSLC